MILWRPVGLSEMALVGESRMRAFPPRLPSQPVFYPVLNEPYATQIARDWNTSGGNSSGYVTRFRIDDSFAGRFEPQVVGRPEHAELWIPAEELAEMNERIDGPIELVGAFFSRGFEGLVPERSSLGGLAAAEQIRFIAGKVAHDGGNEELYGEILANELAIFLNYPFWAASTCSDLGLTPEEHGSALAALREGWDRKVEHPGEEPLGPLFGRAQIVD